MSNLINENSKEFIDDLDKKIIKAFENDIPLTLNPYQKIAENLNIEIDLLLSRLQKLKDKRILKRISAILHHRDSGYKANGMFVCYFDENQIEKAGQKISELEAVSHCYQRQTDKDWNYNFYAMIHAKNKKELENKAARLLRKYKIEDYQILYSVEELKKTSMKYFYVDFDN